MSEPFALFIGTNTAKQDQPGSRGIYSTLFDPETGAAGPPQLAGEVQDPTFVAVHPSRPLLYSASEVYGGEGGFVSAWHIETDGLLSLINTVPSGGRGACFVAVDERHGVVYATNFGSGSIVSFPIREDGGLGETASVVQREGAGSVDKVQAQPRPHSINPHPHKDLVVVADLGTDEVAVYKVEAQSGEILPAPVACVKAQVPGAGPRHVVFHPDGNRFYVVNELNGTISCFTLDQETEQLEEFAQFSIGDEEATWASEIRLHPNGRFLYGAARTPGVLAAFEIQEPDGTLGPLQTIDAGGKVARNFEIDPTGRFLLVANNESDRISFFEIDPDTGILARKEALDLEVCRPACVRFCLGA